METLIDYSGINLIKTNETGGCGVARVWGITGRRLCPSSHVVAGDPDLSVQMSTKSV